MLHDLFQTLRHLSPFLLWFFGLAGVLTWTADRLIEIVPNKSRERRYK